MPSGVVARRPPRRPDGGRATIALWTEGRAGVRRPPNGIGLDAGHGAEPRSDGRSPIVIRRLTVVALLTLLSAGEARASACAPVKIPGTSQTVSPCVDADNLWPHA